jgi:hypothetical protein
VEQHRDARRGGADPELPQLADERAQAFPRKDPACRSEQRPVAAPVDRALHLPTQDPELVAKDKDFNLCGIVGAMVR